LGGRLTPDRFVHAKNATHDDILFSPTKTPEIHVRQVRMYRDGKAQVVLENYQPAEYLRKLLVA
jgi:aminopeptidase